MAGIHHLMLKSSWLFFFFIYCAPLILFLSSLLAGLGCNTLCLDAIVMIYVKCEQMTNVSFFLFFFKKQSQNQQAINVYFTIGPLATDGLRAGIY